ncbi:uncharacterized protein C11orf97 homolog [Pelobates fuscus]|uniref:uncharacterized protein C11orf97 homolog n=1 Tax=Pelobates fuscus TaxID=191477 RepID=UPI002FE4C160
MKRQPRIDGRGCNVALWGFALEEENNEQSWEDGGTGSPPGNMSDRKHFFYVGTPKRIQQITEEERFLQKDEIQVTSKLQAMELDNIWQTEKNVPWRPFNSAVLDKNTFLTHPESYSRHCRTGASNNITTLSNIRDGATSRRPHPKPLTNKPGICSARGKDQTHKSP